VKTDSSRTSEVIASGGGAPHELDLEGLSYFLKHQLDFRTGFDLDPHPAYTGAQGFDEPEYLENWRQNAIANL
jgi:hypothetical protein